MLKETSTASNINRLLSIDPASGSSSDAGFAVYIDGNLVDSGVLGCNKKDKTHKRLADMAVHLSYIINHYDIKMVAIELIRGRFHQVQLEWSVGMVMTICGFLQIVEVPTNLWKYYTDANYVKGDVNDAKMIGVAILNLYRG